MNPPFSISKRETQSRGWLDNYRLIYEHDPDYVAEGLALQIAEQTVRLMKEKGISRSQLASLMGVSKAYVTKILNAPPNLTLRTIAALALALGTAPYAGLELPASSQEKMPPNANLVSEAPVREKSPLLKPSAPNTS